MFEAAVEAGVAAYMAADGEGYDSDVRDRLESQGVAPWLAERLVFFLPLAFGRVVLRDVEVANTFLDSGTERPLDTDPVFAAARARADRAGRDEIERIGLRSAEVNAVNNALNAGSQLDDLLLGPPASLQPLPPVGAGDGGVPSPRATFAQLLAGHGFAVTGRQAGDLRFDARVFPQARSTGVMAQVNFVVSHPRLAPGWLIESFAGWGATWHEALTQSIVRFEQGSLHPIIAGLLDRTQAPDQVSWLPYEHPDGPFELCLGATQTMFSERSSGNPALWPVLDALRSVPLTRAVHGLRLFLSYRDGVLDINEVLLDNEACPPGQAAAAAAPFDIPQGFVTTRLFGLVVPAA